MRLLKKALAMYCTLVSTALANVLCACFNGSRDVSWFCFNGPRNVWGSQVISEALMGLSAEEADGTFATVYMPIVVEGHKRYDKFPDSSIGQARTYCNKKQEIWEL